MNTYVTLKQLLSKSALLAAAAGILALPLPSSAFAKEGVYIKDSVYFALDEVTLSTGADKGSLRFTLQLHNGSGQSIDFNRYGVKIIDSSGVSYTARLSEKVSARVNPQQDQDYKFISQVPANAQSEQLKVDVFEWSSKAPYITEIGALSVSAAMQDASPAAKQVVLSLYELDTALPEDALAAFELGQSYRVWKDGVWNLFTDFYVENLGSTSFKLPAGLVYQYKDNNTGLFYTVLAASGASDNLLPKQRVKITMQASVPAKMDADQLTLQFSKKSGTEKVVIGSMDLKSSQIVNKQGEAAVYPYADEQGIKITTSWAAVSKQSDGLHVQANVTMTNDGPNIISVPALVGQFQVINGNVGLTSVDNVTRPAYLSPKESTTFRYTAVMPSGLSTDDLQFTLLEKKSTLSGTNSQDAALQTGVQQSIYLPVMITSLSGTGSGQETTAYANAQNYTLKDPLALNSNNFIDSNIEVSLMELHMQENSDLGYKTAIAKYKLRNKGTTSVTLPNFQTDLINGSGYTYTGVRQTAAAPTILPNTSNVVSYSFLMPSSDTEDQLAMSLYDDNHSGMGTFKVKAQKEVDEGPISFYPFEVNVKDYSLSYLFSNSTYTYKLSMMLDVTRQEQVVVDPNFSKLVFDLVDALGNVMATQSMNFIGDQKVVSGRQNILLSSAKIDQLQSGGSIRMYEQIDTPNGVTKRLVKVLPFQ